MKLSAGTLLKNGEYTVREVIGQGGFGITYKGVWNTTVKGNLGAINAQLPVAIKEFFFEDYCIREGDTKSITIHSQTGKELFSKFKDKLIKEANILSNLVHPNIVRVLEVFEENNTAYMIMDYLEGESLKDVLKREGKFSIEKASSYIRQIADALAEVHSKNILHLDIKPGNIIIAHRDGKPMLIDFGISKRYNTDHGETSTTPTGRSKGYAPIEQYLDKGAASFSPSLDIYALGATYYHALTGVVPVEANERIINELQPPSSLNALVTPALDTVVMKMLELKKENRYQGVGDFLAALNSALGVPDVDANDDDKTQLFEKNVPDKTNIAAPNPAPQKPAAVEIEKAKKPISKTVEAKKQIEPDNSASKTTEKKPLAKFGWLAIVLPLLGIGGYFVGKKILKPKQEFLGIPAEDLQEVLRKSKARKDSTYTVLYNNYVAQRSYASFKEIKNFAEENKEYQPRVDSLLAAIEVNATTPADDTTEKASGQGVAKISPDQLKQKVAPAKQAPGKSNTSISDQLVVKRKDYGKEELTTWEKLSFETKLEKSVNGKGFMLTGSNALENNFLGTIRFKRGGNGRMLVTASRSGYGPREGQFVKLDGWVLMLSEDKMEFTGFIFSQLQENSNLACSAEKKYVFNRTAGTNSFNTLIKDPCDASLFYKLSFIVND